MNNQQIGRDFDDFLEEEGLLAEVEPTAIKSVIAFQINELMKKTDVPKPRWPGKYKPAGQRSIVCWIRKMNR